MDSEKWIPLEKGQKVIFADGTTGKISDIDYDNNYILISYDELYAELRKLKGNSNLQAFPLYNLSIFYLLGKNVIGNKEPVEWRKGNIEETRQKIKMLTDELEYAKKLLECQRKQLFYVTHNMDGSYRTSAETPLKSPTINESNSEGKL